MPATYPSGITGGYGETLALTTALNCLGAPGQEYKQVSLFSPTTDFRCHWNPAIKKICMYDYSATAGARFIDLTRAMEARSGTGTYLDSMAANDRLYICAGDIIGGLYITVTSANGGPAATITVNYWTGTAWSTITPTDNTTALASTNTVTWTAPTAWPDTQFVGHNTYSDAKCFQQTDSGIDTDAALTTIDQTTVTWDADASTAIPAGTIVRIESELMYVSSTAAVGGLTSIVVRGYLGTTAATHTTNQNVYVVYNGKDQPTDVGKWLQIYYDAAMDADTEIASIWSLNKDTNRLYFPTGIMHYVSLDRRSIGGFEALVAAGSDTLQVNWIKNIQG